MRRRIRLGVQLRTAILIALAALAPIVIIYITYIGRFYSLVTAETIREEQEVAEELSPLISEQIELLDDYMNRLEEQAYFKTLFYGPILGDIQDVVISDEAAAFSDELQQILDEGLIQNVRIYTTMPKDTGIYENASGQELFLPDEKVSANYWHGIIHNSNSAFLHAPSDYLGINERATLGNCAYIFRTTIQYAGNVYPSYVVLYYNNLCYENLLKHWQQMDGSVSYILSNRDAVVASSDEALSGIYRVSHAAATSSLMSSNSFVEKEVAGQTVYAAYYYIVEADWILVMILPRQPLVDLAIRNVLEFSLISLAIVIAIIVIALWISGSLSKRIATISKEMQNVKNGPPKYIHIPGANDEVSDLADSYNYMVDEINLLIEDQKKSAEELRKAEYNSLQAQINPHFLYNTMDMINWMTLQGKNEEASEVIQSLAKFYKLTLSRQQDYSTIADELEHGEIYVQLMNMRYDNIISFVTDVPDELMMYQIPKLSFQPILENAILHGILEKEDRTGTIVLAAWAEEDDICILISDDGVGVEPEKLSEILSEKRSKKTKGNNIAIYNIHNRIQLLYGEKYGLSYASVVGEGCEVTIRVPKYVGMENN